MFLNPVTAESNKGVFKLGFYIFIVDKETCGRLVSGLIKCSVSTCMPIIQHCEQH